MKVLRKSDEKNEKVLRKSLESGKVLGGSWESPEKVLRIILKKSWKSPVKVLRKS